MFIKRGVNNFIPLFTYWLMLYFYPQTNQDEKLFAYKKNRI